MTDMTHMYILTNNISRECQIYRNIVATRFWGPVNVASSEWEIKPSVIYDLLRTTLWGRGYSQHVASPTGLMNRQLKNITAEKRQMEITAFETKLTQLKITVQRLGTVLHSERQEAIKKHLKALRMTLRETHQCKRSVEIIKIAVKEDLSKINECKEGIDAKLWRRR